MMNCRGGNAASQIRDGGKVARLLKTEGAALAKNKKGAAVRVAHLRG